MHHGSLSPVWQVACCGQSHKQRIRRLTGATRVSDTSGKKKNCMHLFFVCYPALASSSENIINVSEFSMLWACRMIVGEAETCRSELAWWTISWKSTNTWSCISSYLPNAIGFTAFASIFGYKFTALVIFHAQLIATLSPFFHLAG